jgi:hypothetical protein
MDPQTSPGQDPPPPRSTSALTKNQVRAAVGYLT